jgi:hypothetical protein
VPSLPSLKLNLRKEYLLYQQADCFQEDTSIISVLRFSQWCGEDPAASLSNRLPMFRRHHIALKRLEFITEWCIISQKNLIVYSSVSFHGRCHFFFGTDLMKVAASCGDSSVPRTDWSFVPNLRITNFTVYPHPQFQLLWFHVEIFGLPFVMCFCLVQRTRGEAYYRIWQQLQRIL